MKVAPIVRARLSSDKREQLEAFLKNNHGIFSIDYLKEIYRKNYVKGRSKKTFPVIEPEDYCEILSKDEDDENIDGAGLVQEKKVQQPKTQKRVKFLTFGENCRTYCGTWSIVSTTVCGRRPFAKEEILDYEYDSEEDLEKIKNEESLCDWDSDGEEPVEEDYEIDNEFFVPDGYLSDGEGEEEEIEDKCKQNATEETPENEKIQKEISRRKNEKFELEMKQKMKPLKPEVYGCLWLGEPDSHPAYTQLVKILSVHKPILMHGSYPISIDNGQDPQSQEAEKEKEETKKFVESFPEKACSPDLDSFLEQIGLEEYISLFRQHEVDFMVFLGLTEKDLMECGVTKFGPRRKMIESINRWHLNVLLEKNSSEFAYAQKLNAELKLAKTQAEKWKEEQVGAISLAKELNRRLDDCHKRCSLVKNSLPSLLHRVSALGLNQLVTDLTFVSASLDDIYNITTL